MKTLLPIILNNGKRCPDSVRGDKSAGKALGRLGDGFLFLNLLHHGHKPSHGDIKKKSRLRSTSIFSQRDLT